MHKQHSLLLAMHATTLHVQSCWASKAMRLPGNLNGPITSNQLVQLTANVIVQVPDAWQSGSPEGVLSLTTAHHSVW